MNLIPNIINFYALFYYGNCVVIDTIQGKLKGVTLQSREGRPFYAFYGIPYAEPPTKNLRFQNPIPAKPWNGVRDATSAQSSCISFENWREITGREDCLYLNVYTPKLTRNTTLPVMVLIHGGRFMHENTRPSKYGPHYFMDKDVVLITFNYRLGIFGFLSTEDAVIPGNFGLKDAVVVLQWVKDYIESFGGDKNKVTVFGGSSGGISAALMLISPLAKGLFHRVITQSGVFINMNEYGVAKRNAWRIGSSLGCQEPTVSESLLSCLKMKSAEQLVEKNLDLYTFGFMLPDFPWRPVIEDEKIPGAFLVDAPYKLYQRKTDIPWIIGMTSSDGALVAVLAYFNSFFKVIDDIEKNYYQYFPQLFQYKKFVKNLENLNELTDIIKQHYFGNSKISEKPHGYSKMQTDFIYLLGINDTSTLYNGPLYIYYYDHRNKETFGHLYGDFEEDMGVFHGDELISMFNWTEAITPVTSGIDLVVSKQMIELWTNFATYGEPNVDEMTWKCVERPKLNYLHIKDGILKQGDELLTEEMHFLESLKKRFS